MHETNHHVRYLHTRVINVVLHFHATAPRARSPHERVTEPGVSHVADVRCFIRIDAGVFDHQLRGWRGISGRGLGNRSGRRRVEFRKQTGSIEEDVEITRAGNFNPRQIVVRLESGLQTLGDRSRRLLLTGPLLKQFREFESNREGHIAEVRTWRDLAHDLIEFHAEQILRGHANAGLKSVLKFYYGHFISHLLIQSSPNFARRPSLSKCANRRVSPISCGISKVKSLLY